MWFLVDVRLGVGVRLHGEVLYLIYFFVVIVDSTSCRFGIFFGGDCNCGVVEMRGCWWCSGGFGCGGG